MYVPRYIETVCIYIHTYIYIYIHRERERDGPARGAMLPEKNPAPR